MRGRRRAGPSGGEQPCAPSFPGCTISGALSLPSPRPVELRPDADDVGRRSSFRLRSRPIRVDRPPRPTRRGKRLAGPDSTSLSSGRPWSTVTPMPNQNVPLPMLFPAHRSLSARMVAAARRAQRPDGPARGGRLSLVRRQTPPEYSVTVFPALHSQRRNRRHGAGVGCSTRC